MESESPNTMSRRLSWPLDHPWYVVLAAGAVLFTVWVIGTRSQPHHVRAAFSTAFNLVSGQSVDVDGQEVGKVSGVKYEPGLDGGSAIVEIGINNDSFWPLHRGTTVESRWGTTIGNGTRRLDLVPGPTSAPAIPEGGIIETKDTLPAVDLDQILNVFTQRTRGHLRSFLGELAGGVQGNATALHNGINASPPALDAANGLFTDLASNTLALQGLISNGDRLTATLASRAPAISDLVTVAGQTFSTFAAHSSGIQQSLQELPGALSQARGTLSRLDSSVDVLNGLINDIRPGAAKLSPLAVSLRPALAELRRLAPLGVSTLRQATAAAPSITRLLDVGTPFMPKVGDVTTELAPMVACMRPYTPELGGAIVGINGWMSTYALQRPNGTPGIRFVGRQQGPYVHQHGVRAMPEVSAATLHAYPPGITTDEFVKLSGKQYAFPRPPGLSVGQPMFLPECGVTTAALDPAKDPEQQP